jgi:hypothetical protein
MAGPKDPIVDVTDSLRISIALDPPPEEGGQLAQGAAPRRPDAASISLPLNGGSGIVTTRPLAFGRVPDMPNPTLMATLSVWYSYDPESRTLTLCSPDHPSSDAPHLSTFPVGSDLATRHYAGARDRAASGDGAQRDMPGAAAWLSTPAAVAHLGATLHSAHQGIVDAALAQGINVAVRTTPPALTPEQEADLRFVYREGLFRGAYDPSVPLGPDDTVHPLHSVWGGTVAFTYGEYFANVIGSTGDPKIAGLSWIQLWYNQFQVAPPQCASLNFPGGAYPCSPYSTNSPVGGHVIVGTVATQVPWGVNYVYIIPICAKHNADDNVYMSALQTQSGIWLKNYHQ